MREAEKGASRDVGGAWGGKGKEIEGVSDVSHRTDASRRWAPPLPPDASTDNDTSQCVRCEDGLPHHAHLWALSSTETGCRKRGGAEVDRAARNHVSPTPRHSDPIGCDGCV